MTKLLSRSCRPLTYLLTFLLLPLVLIVSTGQTARAAVVAVGETVTVQAETRSAFPGEDVRCTFTGYTRLHDTGLYSVRATVRCDWSFGNWGLDSMTLVARDANTSSTNLCRFSGRFGITKKTDTSATLVGNLEVAGPPPAGCILTTGDAYLHAGTDDDGSDNTQATIEGFGWNLGALPEYVEPAPDASCPRFTITQTPRVYDHRESVYTVNSQPADGLKVSFNGSWGSGYTGQELQIHLLYSDKDTGAVRLQDGIVAGYVWKQASGETPGVRTTWASSTDRLGTTISFHLSSTAGIVGMQVTSRNIPSPVIKGPSGQNVVTSGNGVYPNGYYGLTDPAQCSFYFGDKIVSNYDGTTATATDDPAGSVLEGPGGTTGPVEEPVDLPTGDDSDLEDGSCAGFSFTDPSSWAGAGICVLVKAVRALFSVMRDVLGVLTGMASSIVSGILNGLSALFVPSDESLEGMQDALDFTDHENLAGWTDTLTTDGLLGQGASGPAMRETGEMNTLSTPSIVPGVVLTGSCQGPGIAADKLAVLGYEGTLHPFAACDGTMATVAQWTRLLLMMFVGLSAALKVFQMLAVGVGAARSASILGSFDWSEATRR